MKAISIIRSIFADVGWKDCGGCDVMVMGSDNDRYLKLGGKAFGPILDSVATFVEYSGLKVTRLATPYALKVGASSHVWVGSCNRAVVLGRMASKLFGSSESVVKVYSRLLIELGCRVVLAIEPPHELTVACKQLGIPCIELMHSMGYLSYPRIVDDSHTPDGFVCYDSVTAQCLSKIGSRSPDVYQVEHPWVTYFRDPATPRCDSWTPSASLLSAVSRYRKTVLYSLQWGYDGEIASFQGILENGIVSQELEKAVAATPDVCWIFRLHGVQLDHPRYARHRHYVFALKEKYENIITDSSSVPLPWLMSKCDAHVTMSSASCYEASWIGIPSIALCPTLRPGGSQSRYMSDLEKLGSLKKSECLASEIMSWLASVGADVKLPMTTQTVISDLIPKLQGYTKKL